MIKVPKWIPNPLGRYYLYFAHHEGTTIRLAFADTLTGPWTIYARGALSLADSLFCQSRPKPADTQPEILRAIAEGIDGDYPHIASPDVHIDDENQKIQMYFHGRLEDGSQQTRLAMSNDGLNFSVGDDLLGLSYFRVFDFNGVRYAISVGGVLHRSGNGMTDFERGATLTKENYRHGAVFDYHGRIYVVWSRARDCPERLLLSQLCVSGSWREWTLVNTTELHRPVESWEGANEPLEPSRYGGIMGAVNQLRDPFVYKEHDDYYLLYSIAGEYGLAIGKLLLGR